MDEGQWFVIDATRSTDSDDDELTFEIEQTGGRQLVLVPGEDGIFTYEVPYLDADETVTFRVSVSDGEAVTTDDVAITLLNYERTPISTQWAGGLGSVTLQGPVREIGVGNSGGTGINSTVLVISEEGGGFAARNLTLTSGGEISLVVPSLTFEADESDASAAFLFADFNLDAVQDLAVLSRSDGNIETFLGDGDGTSAYPMVNSGGGEVAGACAIKEMWVGEDRPITGSELPGLLVGTDGNGLSALLNDGNPRDLIGAGYQPDEGYFSSTVMLTTSGRACAITGQIDLDADGFVEIYTYDPVRQEFTGYSEPLGSTVEEKEVFSAQLPASGMDIVALATGISNTGSSLLAALFTDGVHEGNHALLIFENEGGAIEQTTIILPNGVPTDFAFASVDAFDPDVIGYSDFDADIVIAVPETPYVYVLENLSSPTVPGASDFADIAFFEVGFGVEQVAVFEVGDASLPSLVTGGSDGTVVIYGNGDTFR